MFQLLLLTVVLLSFTSLSCAYEVTLTWDANSEANLAGYKLYYDIDADGPPYDGIGAIEGNSPIDVGNITTFTIHGLADDVSPRFTITAYNDQGLESGYSNEVVTSLAPENPQGLIATEVAKIIAALQRIKDVLLAQK